MREKNGTIGTDISMDMLLNTMLDSKTKSMGVGARQLTYCLRSN